MEVRAARPGDAEAATAIYNEGIAERVATFRTEPESPAAFAELVARDEFPFVVAELDGRVVGFAATYPYSDFPPYAGILEFGVYVASEARGRGVGAALVEGIASAARERDFHKLIGKVFTTNERSARLMRRCGFREVGVHLRHGQLEGEWKDVLLVERSLLE